MRNKDQEQLIREAVREIIIQEGLLGDLWAGIKSGVSDFFGLDDETDSGEDSSSNNKKKSEILGYRSGDDCKSDVLDSFRCRLGKEKGRGINFHMIEDGKNNYRAGLDEEDTVTSPEFFKELKDDYGIQRVITLNSDSGGDKIPAMVRAAGLESHTRFMGPDDLPNRSEFEEIKRILRQGNTLIHCTHGADRTGTIVGRYMIEDKGWDVNRAVEYTRSLGGHKKGHAYRKTRDFLENGPEGAPSSGSGSSDSKEDLGFFGTIGAALSSLFGDDEPDAPDPRVDGPSGASGGSFGISAQEIASAYPTMASYAEEIVEVSEELGIKPSWLANVINLESGGDPRAVNDLSNATGIIQFMPKTASNLGTSVGEIYSMSGKQQMNLVKKYFEPYKGRLSSQEDVYMAVFYPAAIGKPDFEFPPKVTKYNPGIYSPRDYAGLANRRAKMSTS